MMKSENNFTMRENRTKRPTKLFSKKFGVTPKEPNQTYPFICYGIISIEFFSSYFSIEDNVSLIVGFPPKSLFYRNVTILSPLSKNNETRNLTMS